METVLLDLTILVGLGCGLVAGIFFAFSNFVMKALAGLARGSGLPAMQAINVTVLNPLFLGIFLGTGIGSLALGAVAAFHWKEPLSPFLANGSLLYLAGNIVVTGTCNVPRNSALAGLDATDGGSEKAWRRYVREWTRWNHVRTVTAAAGALSYMMAISKL